VDANGCPTDQDRDGVPDGIDQCPDTPEGADVDERGCTLERDADGDGVPDSRDRCPNTREGQQVDAVGCPILFEVADADVDGDGVPDARDRCPGTAAGRQVDANGCPILFQVEQGQRRPLILRGVTFASGRSTLTPASYTTLDEVAASLVANPEVRIEIVGHTDATGSRTVNTELSLARALAVRAYLAQRDVDPTRMEARGYGPDRPIATNATAAGRNQNRRVEINLLPGANQ
jgi:OOP family OmpA-OmpF porin